MITLKSTLFHNTKELVEQTTLISESLGSIRKDIEEYGCEGEIGRKIAMLILRMNHFTQLVSLIKEEVENCKA